MKKVALFRKEDRQVLFGQTASKMNMNPSIALLEEEIEDLPVPADETEDVIIDEEEETEDEEIRDEEIKDEE